MEETSSTAAATNQTGDGDGDQKDHQSNTDNHHHQQQQPQQHQQHTNATSTTTTTTAAIVNNIDNVGNNNNNNNHDTNTNTNHDDEHHHHHSRSYSNTDSDYSGSGSGGGGGSSNQLPDMHNGETNGDDDDDDGIIKILVVDDDRVTRTVLKKLLGKMGYEAHTASGGRKALEQLLRSDFQLMLVDVMMPEMDGFSLIRVFKQASSREIPCIMMSGSEDPETLAKCFQCGAEDFLPKPIKEEILKARIEKCLVYRKRKLREKIYKDLLSEEKRLKKELTEQRDRNKEQLEEFKKKVSDTIETPLQVVMETISDLMNGKYESEQYKVALITIMKSLSSSALYRPAFVDYVQNAKMDDSVRDWLVNQYSKDGEDAIFHDAGIKRRKSKSGSAGEHQRRKSSVPMTTNGEQQQQQQHELNSQQSSSSASSNHGTGTAAAAAVVEEDETLPFDLESYVPELTNGASIESIHYGCFDYTVDELKKHAMYMFKQLDLFERFNFRPIRLWNLLEKLSTLYRTNFYHNFVHAIDVTQYVYVLINSDKICDMLSLEEKFMILTAALCHDVDHPGVNNNFLINTQDDLALMYNDRSVLENYHASYAFKLLGNPKYNILEGVDDELYKEFRRTVVGLILATDMANHFSICSKFQARISTGALLNDAVEDRMLLLKIIMKCADINNSSRPFPIAKKWADMCIREFLQQGDQEKARNIPVSPLMDRDTLNFPKSQIGFADFVAAPLFKHLSTAFPSLTYMYNSIMNNRSQWQMIFDENERQNRETLEKPVAMMDDEDVQQQEHQSQQQQHHHQDESTPDPIAPLTQPLPHDSSSVEMLNSDKHSNGKETQKTEEKVSEELVEDVESSDLISTTTPPTPTETTSTTTEPILQSNDDDNEDNDSSTTATTTTTTMTSTTTTTEEPSPLPSDHRETESVARKSSAKPRQSPKATSPRVSMLFTISLAFLVAAICAFYFRQQQQQSPPSST